MRQVRRRLEVEIAALRELCCVECGCTEDDPCIDGITGEACCWTRLGDEPLCSLCAEQAPLVGVFSEAEANAYIRELRVRAAGG